MNKEKVLTDILSENWKHIRHIENGRLQFTIVYSGLIGAMLAILEKVSSKLPFLLFLSLFFTLLSLFGLLWTIKANAEIDNR